MDEYLSEKEQVEELKKIWKQHGAFIVTGLILGLAAVGGWKYWNQYKVDRGAAASAHYEQLSEAIAGKDSSGAQTIYEKLATDFSATPYASQGALAMARVAVGDGDLELASQYLQAALDQTKDDRLRLVTRPRLARVLLALERPDEALAVLDVEDTGNFAGRFHDVRGDVYAALGRSADARVEYQAALDNFEPGLFDRGMVEMKLNDLAGTDSPNEPDA